MILNVRPAFYRDATHRAWGHLGLPIVDAPLLVPQKIPSAVPAAIQFDAIVFTSQLAVDAFDATDAWREKRVFAVGAATALAATNAGYREVVCTGQDAADLTATLAADRSLRVIYPSAVEVAADLARAFPDRVTRVPVYRTDISPELPSAVVQELRAASYVFVPLLSRRSARAAQLAFTNAGLSRATVNATSVAISLAALDMSDRAPWRAQTVAAEPTVAGVAEEIARHAGSLMAGSLMKAA
ncbi:MAG: uroporphyrinogen-III synthase [Rhodobacteraceae bacterium]|nr:uroporphyrinogen-III synthase [Paracoccaceae bacterium]